MDTNSFHFALYHPDDASKAAVAHLTRGLALDLAPEHIIVNNLAPGIFPSRMSQASISKMERAMVDDTLNGRLGNEADIAGIALWLCSRASAHVVGQTVVIDGGWGLNTGISRL